MAPSTWSRKKSEISQVSERMVQQAWQLEITNRVCSLPPPRNNKTLCNKLIQAVKKSFTRTMKIARSRQVSKMELASEKMFMNKNACFFALPKNSQSIKKHNRN